MDVKSFNPDFAYNQELGGDGLIVIAPGDTCYCVSRYFTPNQGVDGDLITGNV